MNEFKYFIRRLRRYGRQRLRLGRYSNTVITLALLSVIGSAMAYQSVQKLERSATLAMAEQVSKALIRTVNNARTLYSKNAVTRVEDLEAITVGADYLKHSHGIPNPATLAIELAESVSDRDDMVYVSMYSDYPFPGREKTGGPKDQFELEALEFFDRFPGQAFSRAEKVNGTELFRYAEAIIMEPSCVACHNTIADSPKRDWQVGQVRGAVTLAYPLLNYQSSIRHTMSVAYISFSVLAVIGLISLGIMVLRLNSVSNELEIMVSKRTHELLKFAESDPLTGIANKRAFNRALELHWENQLGKGQELSLIAIDLDQFKPINDNYGHDAGDECLRSFTERVAQTLRTTEDVFARCGGDEFAVILPQTSAQAAAQVAELIRIIVGQIKIAPHDIELSCSLGVATIKPDEQHNPKMLMQRADRAMYSAKAQGRNQVVSWHPGLETTRSTHSL